jgi:hypothetical protein
MKNSQVLLVGTLAIAGVGAYVYLNRKKTPSKDAVLNNSSKPASSAQKAQMAQTTQTEELEELEELAPATPATPVTSYTSPIRTIAPKKVSVDSSLGLTPKTPAKPAIPAKPVTRPTASTTRPNFSSVIKPKPATPAKPKGLFGFLKKKKKPAPSIVQNLPEPTLVNVLSSAFSETQTENYKKAKELSISIQDLQDKFKRYKTKKSKNIVKNEAEVKSKMVNGLGYKVLPNGGISKI